MQETPQAELMQEYRTASGHAEVDMAWLDVAREEIISGLYEGSSTRPIMDNLPNTDGLALPYISLSPLNL